MADGGSSQIRNGMVTDRPLFGFNMYQSNAIAVSGGSDSLSLSALSKAFCDERKNI